MTLFMLRERSYVRAMRRFCSSTSMSGTSASSKNFALAVSYAEKILRDKANVIRTVSDDEYTRKWPQFFGASIGEHIRHSCDHFKQVSSMSRFPSPYSYDSHIGCT